jgi:hypothetical protein
LSLRNGVKLQLGASSKARVYSDRVTLERGTGQISPAKAFELEAAGLKIQGSGLRVKLGEQIEVAALTSVARVSSSQGTLLASIPAGRTMNLAFQAGQNGTLMRTGCLLYKENHFILQDENTMEVVELAGGQNLASNLGNRVQATGTASTTKAAVSIATSVLNVSAVSSQSTGGCLVAASTLNAQTEIPRGVTPQSGQTAGNSIPASAGQTAPKAGGGMSAGAKAAIIIGVAGGGGAGAAIALMGKKSSTSP